MKPIYLHIFGTSILLILSCIILKFSAKVALKIWTEKDSQIRNFYLTTFTFVLLTIIGYLLICLPFSFYDKFNIPIYSIAKLNITFEVITSFIICWQLLACLIFIFVGLKKERKQIVEISNRYKNNPS